MGGGGVLEKVVVNMEEKKWGLGKRDRNRKRGSTLVPAVLKSFQTSTVIPGFAI